MSSSDSSEENQADILPSVADLEYQALGQNILNLREMPQPDHYVCFTLSAYPRTQVTKKNMFIDITPTEQRSYYYYLLKDMFMKYKDKLGFTVMHIHYELNKSGMIHVHGYVDIMESKFGYKIWLEELSAYCHKRIGKKGNNRKISSRFEYPINGVEKYKEYCNKENVFKKSIIRTPNILDYITCLR